MATTEHEPYEVERDKEHGTVMVSIWNDGITTQKADTIARSMFVVPVKLFGKATNRGDQNMDNLLDLRFYKAEGWLA